MLANKEKFLIVGSGGRESSFALNLMQDSKVYAVIDHENPTIIAAARSSGGDYLVGNSNDPEVVSEFACKHKVDYAFISSDNALAAGVINELLKHSIKAVGGTKEATRIEWDKVYGLNLIKEECPEVTPYFIEIKNKTEIKEAIDKFIQRGTEVVVKPQGLTGGKGVKLMTEHLADYKSCEDYVAQLIVEKPEESVLLVEKIKGEEFTIMGLTDGSSIVLSPASYDYPFRFANDQGPGTGGMGCFTCADGKLPFLEDDDLNTCQKIMHKIITRISQEGHSYKGVINGGFFKTEQGIKFMEFNARFGDPEGINILATMTSSLASLIRDLSHTQLSNKSVAFMKKASVVKYLVAREYPAPSPAPILYSFDSDRAEQMGVQVVAANTKKQPNSNNWTTLKRSRVLAVVHTADTIAESANHINKVIDECLDGDLEYRKDIGLESKYSSL